MAKKQRAAQNSAAQDNAAQREAASTRKKKKSVIRAEEKAAAKAKTAPAAAPKKEKKAGLFARAGANPALADGAAAAAGPLFAPMELALIIVYFLLLFAAMTLQTGAMSLLLVVLAVLACIGKEPLRRLRQRFCVPAIAFALFALLNGAAAVYSNFGGYAASELIKLLASLSMAVILLVRFDKKHIPALLWGIVAACAAVSLLCVDMGGSGALLKGFTAITSQFGVDYSNGLESTNTLRVQGLYNDGNITGAILGIAMLLGLHLAASAENRKKRLIADLLLGVCIMGFLTAMSRGAMACFGVAAIVYLCLVGTKGRFRLLLLMLWCAVATGVTGAAALTQLGVGSAVPDLMAIACGLVIFALDELITQRLCERVGRYANKVVAACCGVLVVLAVVGAAVALNVTGPYTFSGDSFARSVELSGGSYTVDSDYVSAGDTINVYIYSRTDEQALMATRTDLYNGPLASAAFELDGGTRVYFEFSGAEGDRLNQVTLSDGSTLKLKYRFLPESIASRLQDGMLEGQNVLQRIQFWKDGMAMFAMSPLTGNGLGSVEGLVTSVQPFYYESLYVHNHFIQILDETGILGLALFLIFMIGGIVLLVRNLKTEDRSWVAALLAALVMMNAHSFMEISFSVRAYQCVAYIVLMLPVVAFAQPLRKAAARTGGYVLLALLLAFEVIFGGMYALHRRAVNDWAGFSTNNLSVFMTKLEDLASMDVLDPETYQLSYVANVANAPEGMYDAKAEKYVAQLRGSGTYTACSGLERYWYLPRGEHEELFACAREGVKQEASSNDAWNLQFDFFRQEVLPAMDSENMELFISGVLDMKAYLEEYSEGRLESIALSEDNQAFLDACTTARENNLPGEIAKLFLTSLSGQDAEAAS